MAEKAGKATVVRSARKSTDEVEMAISKIDALRKRQIGRALLIRKFSYSKEVSYEGGLIAVIDVTLTDGFKDDGRDFGIRFLNVADLRIHDLNALFGGLITVSDIASRGWEGLRYRVIDDEEQWFSFYCKDFEVYDVVELVPESPLIT